VIVSLLIANFQSIRASTILVATATGGIFALFMPLVLLNAEGTGLEYTKTLPVDAGKIIISKTLITTTTYALVPLTLLCLAFTKPLTSPLAVLIPYAIMLAIAAASILEIKLFLNSAAKGRIAALVYDLEKLIAGITIMLVPEIAYVTAYFVSFDHILAILTMSGAAAAELAMAVYALNNS
jgi:predicted permease